MICLRKIEEEWSAAVAGAHRHREAVASVSCGDGEGGVDLEASRVDKQSEGAGAPGTLLAGRTDHGRCQPAPTRDRGRSRRSGWTSVMGARRRSRSWPAGQAHPVSRLLAALLVIVPQAIAGVPLAPPPSSSEGYRCCCAANCRCTGPCCHHSGRPGRAAGPLPSLKNGIPEVADGGTCRLPLVTTPRPPEGTHHLFGTGGGRPLLPPPHISAFSRSRSAVAASALDPGAASPGPRAPPMPVLPATN